MKLLHFKNSISCRVPQSHSSDIVLIKYFLLFFFYLLLLVGGRQLYEKPSRETRTGSWETKLRDLFTDISCGLSAEQPTGISSQT